jgi:hypothetical protein
MNEMELMDEKCENDLRTDYSEKDMDIENDICSSERISEVCSPTTSLVIEKNLQMTPPMTAQHLTSPKAPSASQTPTKINDIEPVQKPSNQQDSDECETIDKIAEMVSDLTANKVPESPSIPTPIAPEVPSTSFPISENQSKIMEEVENRLEEMFAEPSTSHHASVPEIPEKFEDKTPATSVPNTPSSSSTKKPVNRNRGKNGGAKRKKPANGRGKQNGKNMGKMGNKMNGNGKDFGKEIKTPAQKKEMNGKTTKKQENGVFGPILQIQKDGSFNIVNQTTNGDDDPEKTLSKIKKGITNLDKSKVIRGMHVSTLSNKYDADTKDMTW